MFMVGLELGVMPLGEAMGTFADRGGTCLVLYLHACLVLFLRSTLLNFACTVARSDPPPPPIIIIIIIIISFLGFGSDTSRGKKG